MQENVARASSSRTMPFDAAKLDRLMEAAGLNYYSVGRPDVVGEHPVAIKAALKEAARQNEAA